MLNFDDNIDERHDAMSQKISHRIKTFHAHRDDGDPESQLLSKPSS
jgi:hypothetical protein